MGVEIASKELGISGIDIKFRNKSFFPNPFVNAMFLYKSYTIVFNIDWLEQANEFEILKCAFHEVRHAYQRMCIDFPEYIQTNVGYNILEIWRQEFKDYQNPNSESYLKQEIEKDAIEFSESFLKEIIEDLDN